MKKRWVRPKLIVLVRGKPEESVLGGCKTQNVGGAQNVYHKCQTGPRPSTCVLSSCLTYSTSS